MLNKPVQYDFLDSHYHSFLFFFNQLITAIEGKNNPVSESRQRFLCRRGGKLHSVHMVYGAATTLVVVDACVLSQRY